MMIALAGCSAATQPTDEGADAMADTGLADVDQDTASDAATDAVRETGGEIFDTASDAVAPDSIDATGEDAADVPELPIYDEPPVRVLFDLLGKLVESPYPSDHYIDPEDGTIKLAPNGFNNSALYLIEMDVPKYAEDAARAHGWALYSPMVFMTSTEVDPATIPADGEASLQEDSSVRMYLIDGEELVQQRIKCVFKRFQEARDFNMTQCRPLYRMQPDSKYLFVVTDAVKDVNGNAVERSRGFMQALGLARVEGEQPAERLELMHRTGEATAAVMALMQDSSHVAAASVFTTGHPQTEMEDLMSLFKQGAPLQPVDYVLPTDGEGQEIIFDGASLPECSLANEFMAWGLHGIFHAPEFRNAEGNFERDDAGAFMTFTGEDIPFLLMVPEGDGPFPVVIAQHGMEGDEGSMCNVGRELVRRDIAVLSFVWPGHGGINERGNGQTDFLDVLSPARIAYNFMQSATEVASAIILLDQINADMTALRPEGDGLPPLDTSNIGYVGMSLGSIIGLMYLPFSDRIDLMVSNVGGVGMSHLVEQFLQVYFPGLYMGACVTNLADHVVAIGDGVSNADRIFTKPVEWATGPKYLLAQEVIGDEVVSNASTEVLARNAGLKLVNPVAVPIEGIEAADPATLTSGLFQFVGTNHHQFTSNPGAPVPDTERFQAWHYLETGLKSGVPEIKVFEPVVE